MGSSQRSVDHTHQLPPETKQLKLAIKNRMALSNNWKCEQQSKQNSRNPWEFNNRL